MWTLTKLEIKENLLESLVKNLEGCINSLSFKHLSMLSWCLAKNKIRNPQFFAKISMRVCEILRDGAEVKEETSEVPKTREDSTIKQKSDSESDSEVEFVENPKTNDLDNENKKNESFEKNSLKIVNPQSLGLILWAFGKSRMRDEDLFQLIGDLILKNFEMFTAKLLNIVLYAYKSVKIKSKVWIILYLSIF